MRDISYCTNHKCKLNCQRKLENNPDHEQIFACVVILKEVNIPEECDLYWEIKQK